MRCASYFHVEIREWGICKYLWDPVDSIVGVPIHSLGWWIIRQGVDYPNNVQTTWQAHTWATRWVFDCGPIGSDIDLDGSTCANNLDGWKFPYYFHVEIREWGICKYLWDPIGSTVGVPIHSLGWWIIRRGVDYPNNVQTPVGHIHELPDGSLIVVLLGVTFTRTGPRVLTTLTDENTPIINND